MRPGPVTAEHARARLAEVAAVGVEEVNADQADGRVLAEEVRAPEELPAWPRAMMDGFAVRAADGPGPLRVVAEVGAGEVWAGPLAPGCALGIATGGVVPDGADAVVRLEDTVRAGDTVRVTVASVGQNVDGPGADLARGSLVARAGRRLRPQELAALAALGVVRVRVHRRPLVAVLATGAEVVPAGARPGPGQVRDANTPAHAAQLVRAGCVPLAAGALVDDADALAARLTALAAGPADAVLLSGGSSVGARDLAGPALAAAGAELVFHGIEVRPGRPALFARLGGKPVLGLPGVPASAQLIFDAFARACLLRLGGEVGPEPFPARARVPLARAVASTVGREDWLRVRVEGGAAVPLPGGSALSTLLAADGLVVVPAARAGLDAGELVDVLLYV
jgi:molybdopterin molybdotransferase